MNEEAPESELYDFLHPEVFLYPFTEENQEEDCNLMGGGGGL